jgi:hypothetical protein
MTAGAIAPGSRLLAQTPTPSPFDQNRDETGATRKRACRSERLLSARPVNRMGYIVAPDIRRAPDRIQARGETLLKSSMASATCA